MQRGRVKPAFCLSSFWMRINHDHSCRIMQILAAGLGKEEGTGSRESKGHRLTLLPRAPSTPEALCLTEELQEPDSQKLFSFRWLSGSPCISIYACYLPEAFLDFMWTVPYYRIQHSTIFTIWEQFILNKGTDLLLPQLTFFFFY